MEQGSRKRRPRNVPARMAEYVSDFMIDEGRSPPIHDFSPQPSSHQPSSAAKTHPSLHPTPASPISTEDKDLDHSNHDMCDNCGEGGDLLCCDRCPASFHLLCAEPPLSVIPDGDWYCKQCTATLYPVPPHTLSKNPVVATLLSKLRAMNPVVYTLPKEIYEVAKKGKSFTELGEGGRQMGSGTTAVDVFGNRVLQGVCSICTVEGKQLDLIACSMCRTIYHTYCMDPVLTTKPTGFWICPNHDMNAMLPPGVSRMVKVTPSDPRHREVVHLLPGNTMRLDFEPHPYGGPSDDSNDSADSNASDVSSDDSNASGPPGRKRGPRQKTSQFQAVVLALREAARARRDYESKKPEFDSFTYLEDFYDEEAYEEIDLFTPPEDQTRLLLNLSGPQRLRFNKYLNRTTPTYDPASNSQKRQIEDLIAQQRTYTRGAMPADTPSASLFSIPPITSPPSVPNSLSTPSPSTSGSANTSNSHNITTNDDKMDTSSNDSTSAATTNATSSTPTSTTSAASPTNNINNNNNKNNISNPIDALFAHGAGSPLALSQLSPLFTQFLAWQRLMQINQQIQQQNLPPHEQAILQQMHSQQPKEQQQHLEHLQEQQNQIRQYYEVFQAEQRLLTQSTFNPPPPPPARWSAARDATDIDAGWRHADILPARSVVPHQPRVPLRARSPRSQPFAKSAWMRDRIALITSSSLTSPDQSTTSSPDSPDKPGQLSPSPSPTLQSTKKPKVTNHTSSYGNSTHTKLNGRSVFDDYHFTTYTYSTKSSRQSMPDDFPSFVSPFSIRTTNTSAPNTPFSDHSTNDSPYAMVERKKETRGRKRKVVPPVVEAPTSPKKAPRRVRKPPVKHVEVEEKYEEEKEVEGEEKEVEGDGERWGGGEEGGRGGRGKKQQQQPKRSNEFKPLRGKGGRFVHKDLMPGQEDAGGEGDMSKDGEQEEREVDGEEKDKSMEENTHVDFKDQEEKEEANDGVPAVDVEENASMDSEEGKEESKEDSKEDSKEVSKEERKEESVDNQIPLENREQEQVAEGAEQTEEEEVRLVSLRREEDLKLLTVNAAVENNETEAEKEQEGGQGGDEVANIKMEELAADTEAERQRQQGEEERNQREREREQQQEQERERMKEKEREHEEERERQRKEVMEGIRATTLHSRGSETAILDAPPPKVPSPKIEPLPIIDAAPTSSLQTEPAIKPEGPAEVGPKRSTRVREKGEKNKMREAKDAAKEKGEEKKPKGKRKDTKKSEVKEGGEVVEKKRSDKKRKKDEEQQQPEGGDKKKKTEKKKKGEAKKKKQKKGNGVDISHMSPTSSSVGAASRVSTPASSSDGPNDSKKAKSSQKKGDLNDSDGAVVGWVPNVITMSEELKLHLDDETTYATPIGSLIVHVLLDPESTAHAQASAHPPVRFDVVKRVTSLGRNRQNRNEGDPEEVDIDLAIFGQAARAASHLHAYIVHSPPALQRAIPEFTLWLMGRNFTKVNGVLHRDGIVPLASTSVLKICKLRLDFQATNT